MITPEFKPWSHERTVGGPGTVSLSEKRELDSEHRIFHRKLIDEYYSVSKEALF